MACLERLAASRITTVTLDAIRFLDRILVRVLVRKTNETQDHGLPLSNGDLDSSEVNYPDIPV